MRSFGGDLPDSAVICAERVCQRDAEIMIHLGDSEEECGEDNIGPLSRVEWVGEGEVGDNGKIFYEKAVLENRNGEFQEITSGDYLLIRKDKEDHRSVPFYPCRVIFLLTMDHERQTLDLVHIYWYLNVAFLQSAKCARISGKPAH
jgi:hypothetical protein